jgi:beta-galactosidase
VFTNCEEVDLLLNGKSLGIKKAEAFPSKVMSWALPFKKGEILAIGRINGQEVARHELVTALEAEGLQAKLLDPEPTSEEVDIRHIEINIVDKKGTLVFLDDIEVSCDASGPIKLLGLEDANPRNIEDYRSNKRHSFHGKLMAYVQLSNDSDEMANITFSSDGLKSAVIEFE